MYERIREKERENRNGDDLITQLLQNLEDPPWKEISESNGYADSFSRRLTKRKPKLEITQLRKFFDSIKRISHKINEGCEWKEVEMDVWALIPALKYAKSRNLCNEDFVRFVEVGLKKVSDAADDNRKKELFNNFAKIFEAVVAYSKYHSEENKEK